MSRTLDQIKDIRMKLQGGPGSGNFGHAGRPGKVGGSAPKGSAISAETTKVKTRTRADFLLDHFEPEGADFIDRQISEVANWGWMNGRENIVMLGENYEWLRREYGRESYVTLTDEQWAGADISIHNHPTSAPFSSGDIATFVDTDQRTMIVVGHNGDIGIMEKPDGWEYPYPETGWLGTQSKVKGVYKFGLAVAEDKYIENLKQAGLPIQGGYSAQEEELVDEIGRKTFIRHSMPWVAEQFGLNFSWLFRDGWEVVGGK